MGYELWSQDVFSKGELSPFMYARATVTQYLDGLKTAQNVLTYPTGAAGKRFGTLYQNTLTGFTSANDIFFQAFQYLNETTYQLVFAPLAIYIYLEGGLVATVTTTFDGPTTYNLSSTVLNNIFRVAGQGFAPFDLTRAADAGNVMVGVASNIVTLTTPTAYNGLVIPFQFTKTGTGIQTNPQVNVGVTYFARFLTASTFQIYGTSLDAANQTNVYTISGAGTGTTTIITLNTWSFTNTVIKNFPVYDFTGGYDTITFTPNATEGATVTLTASSAIFTTAMLNGVFFGGGGVGLIHGFTDSTHVTIATKVPFSSTNAILGALCLLTEPAWSTARGFPQKCSSYQNRALFANTTSLPNGFWASTVNDYTDFGNFTNDDDEAISWFPTSNDINFIRFIVPYRSITVHTNSGIYSSPLSDTSGITPNNFTLQLQDSTPADVLLPQAIDNQILVLSGNDAHQMLWDGINNAYTSDIVSIINEQTINNPVDETAFADLKRAGSRFVFIINANGSMAIFQTLLSQNVSGFTPHIMEQSYGNAYFRQACSNSEGRCWFVIERQIATSGTNYDILSVSGTSLQTAIASNFSTTIPTAVIFSTTGSLPTSSPQILAGVYYWVIGIDATHVHVYLSQADALAGVNAINFTALGSNSKMRAWPLSTVFTLEELTRDTFLDCAVKYNSSPASTITTGAIFNAQDVKMVGDGYGFEAVGVNNQVTFTAHGSTVNVSHAYIGFPIHTIMEPMPLSMSNGTSAKNTTLTKPKHIRTIRFMFNNTIGGTINGIPIVLQPFDQVPIGAPPTPARGIFEMALFKSWNDFNNPSYTIEHSDPFDIQLLGVFYSVEV